MTRPRPPRIQLGKIPFGLRLVFRTEWPNLVTRLRTAGEPVEAWYKAIDLVEREEVITARRVRVLDTQRRTGLVSEEKYLTRKLDALRWYNAAYGHLRELEARHGDFGYPRPKRRTF